MKTLFSATGLLLIKVVFALLTVITNVSGQCAWMTVSGSEYSSITGINGNYELVYDYLCDDLNIWVKDDYPINYIFYSTLIISDNSSQSGWVIAPEMCHAGSVAKNPSGYSYYPFMLAAGTWQELDPYTNTFVDNQNLTMNCSSGLSSGAIVGIVIGSICGLIILLSLLACIIQSCKLKKLQRTQTDRRHRQQNVIEMPPMTEPTYATPYSGGPMYCEQIGSQPADFDQMITSIGMSQVVLPPPYDNLTPPQYTTDPENK